MIKRIGIAINVLLVFKSVYSKPRSLAHSLSVHGPAVMFPSSSVGESATSVLWNQGNLPQRAKNKATVIKRKKDCLFISCPGGNLPRENKWHTIIRFKRDSSIPCPIQHQDGGHLNLILIRFRVSAGRYCNNVLFWQTGGESLGSRRGSVVTLPRSNARQQGGRR